MKSNYRPSSPNRAIGTIISMQPMETSFTNLMQFIQLKDLEKGFSVTIKRLK